MRRTTLTALLVAAALSASVVAVASAAPVAAKAPTITGRPAYQQTLTCNKGTWSADAVSFSYAWAISGGSTIATGPTLKVPASAIDYDVVCIVTARDAQGQTTPASSAQVLIAPGISTVRITRAAATNGVVTISGFVGPATARTRGPDGWSMVVLDRIISAQEVQQLSNPKIVRSRNGAFTLSAHDVRGKHTYVIDSSPPRGRGSRPGKPRARSRCTRRGAAPGPRWAERRPSVQRLGMTILASYDQRFVSPRRAQGYSNSMSIAWPIPPATHIDSMP